MSTSPPSKPAAVALHGIAKKFGQFVALREVSLSIPPGEFVCFRGQSAAIPIVRINRCTRLRFTGHCSVESPSAMRRLP